MIQELESHSLNLTMRNDKHEEISKQQADQTEVKL